MNLAFTKAKPVLEEIERHGYEAYFVGGSVRDFLMNQPINDVDIATSATPFEIKTIFEKTIDVGIEHGTVVVLYNEEAYEITTFRSEAEYEDFRRPSKVDFIRSLEEDLKRRDFTMNAIAMDARGTIIDPFNGQQSIQEKVIMTVGKAEERFREDALRMMRAVRFVSKLSFELDEQTYLSLIEFGYLLEHIAVERKLVEFEKLLMGTNHSRALHLLIDTGLYLYLPGLDGYKISLYQLIDYEIDLLTLEERWALLLATIQIPESEMEPFLREWKLPVKRLREIQRMVKWLSYRQQQEWTSYTIYQAGVEHTVSVEKLYNCLKKQPLLNEVNELAAKHEQLAIRSFKELKVTGNDLMEWLNRKGGPWIKDALAEIEEMIVNQELLNEPNQIREWVMSCKQM
jgi:tRNA nucleotidyltransferase (CCA-adding enzyme)